MLRACRARATRAYHTGAGVWGHQPAAEPNLAQEVLGKEILGARAEHSNAWRLVSAYRRHGHKCAAINPVALEEPKPAPELDPSRYGLNGDTRVPTLGLLNGPVQEIAVAELGTRLASLYCGPTAIEADHLENEAEQEWLHSRYEALQDESLTPEQRVSLAGHLLRCQAFDNFLATKFQSVKRYGGEGAEAMMGFFTELLNVAKQQNLNQIVLGQAHRGRLNLLTGLLGFPPVAMFRKMRGLPEFPSDQYGAGDVLSHLTASLEVDGVRLTMLPNPSHLEAVNPVAAGKARGREMRAGRGQYGDERVGEGALCVQVHGDGALAGQGVNQETLQISQVPHYSVGGSLHLVVNNQVAFTAPGERGRSSTHCTGLARQIEAPVIHVNGDCPEEVVKATRLAMEYRQKFRKDVFVDLVCFRRWGHNELDDPTMTNPALYAAIQARRSVPDLYSDSLISDGLLSEEERKMVVGEHMDWLSENFRQIESYQPERSNLKAQWKEMREPEPTVTDWDTGLPSDVLKFVGSRSVKAPEDFNLHPQLKKTHVEARLKKLEAGTGLDWGTCEALAMGSLLYQGWNVRISGQDVGRATFAHRHAMLVDQDTNEIYIPLNDMVEEQKGKLEIANSILSEEAVLGFEYGMSVESPDNLIIWEAQFGDFFNGAQIMLDTYVANGESKWGLQSGLTILLPHGMDGAGPEHSSCRLERFLQMTDSREVEGDTDMVNWEVVQPTTGAQYFHLLRRQMVRPWRKPLVVVAPKTLLRLPAAASSLAEVTSGTSFQTVISDPAVKAPEKVETVVLVSGRHYYTLAKHIEENKIANVAVVRLESLCPFPIERLQQEVARFKNAKKWVWSQEEHRNQGAWSFVKPRASSLLGIDLQYVGRAELCQPAVGVGQVHRREVEQLLVDTFSS